MQLLNLRTKVISLLTKAKDITDITTVTTIRADIVGGRIPVKAAIARMATAKADTVHLTILVTITTMGMNVRSVAIMAMAITARNSAHRMVIVPTIMAEITTNALIRRVIITITTMVAAILVIAITANAPIVKLIARATTMKVASRAARNSALIVRALHRAASKVARSSVLSVRALHRAASKAARNSVLSVRASTMEAIGNSVRIVRVRPIITPMPNTT